MNAIRCACAAALHDNLLPVRRSRPSVAPAKKPQICSPAQKNPPTGAEILLKAGDPGCLESPKRRRAVTVRAVNVACGSVAPYRATIRVAVSGSCRLTQHVSVERGCLPTSAVESVHMCG